MEALQIIVGVIAGYLAAYLVMRSSGQVGDYDSSAAWMPPPTTRACIGIGLPGRVTRMLECQGCMRYQLPGLDRMEPPKDAKPIGGRLHCPIRIKA